MKIFIKVSPQDYERLRGQIPTDSAAREAIDKATPIQYGLDGVQFEGYNIPCSEGEASIILEVAKQCCPDMVRDIEKVIILARRGAS